MEKESDMNGKTDGCVSGWVWCLSAAMVLVSMGLTDMARAEEANGWPLIFKDDFDRQVVSPHWLLHCADGSVYIEKGGARIRCHPAFFCTKPLPGDNVRVELDLHTPWLQHDQHYIRLALREGEASFNNGGFGINDSFGITLKIVKGTEKPTLSADGTLAVAPDRTHKVALQIAGGTGTVWVDGQQVFQRPVPEARSEVNRYFKITAYYCNTKALTLDNVRIFAKSKAAPSLPVRPNTPAQNRQATVYAAKFIDSKNASLGIQKAIDSLPPTGGVVILPTGTLLMRRHLRLPSNVSLRGQGAGKTILKAASQFRCTVKKLDVGEGTCTVTLEPTDAKLFRVGDGVCFGEKWTNPIYDTEQNADCIVTAIKGNKLTVRGTPTEKGAKSKLLCHFFPLVYARRAEFVEVKDMSLQGADKPGSVWGAFEVSPATFGLTVGVRFSRVDMLGWRGDGLSIQGASDAILTDNTATKSYFGLHPGGTTCRLIFSRNRSIGNKKDGLYFCYHNRNGIYFQNTLDSFGGYAWPKDRFNTIACNRSTGPLGVEQGHVGVIFNNRFEKITVGHGHKNSPTEYFLLANNRTAEVSFKEGNVQKNLFAGNRLLEGDAAVVPTGSTVKSITSADGAPVNIDGLSVGIDRTGPVPPPALPQPVVDGRKVYTPDAPDGGFQKALDELAKGGGTLLLPGGRYPLGRSLKVPSGVTLAGRGLGTVLYAADAMTDSLVVAEGAKDVTVRELTVLGAYGGKASRKPAIAFRNVTGGRIEEVDVRGWEGSAVAALKGSVTVRDNRAIGCAGDGFSFDGGKVDCTTNIARGCRNGFVVKGTGAGSRLTGNIAGWSAAGGYDVQRSPGLLLLANNASFSARDGFRLTGTEKALVVANTAMNNNQAFAGHAGIRLGAGSKGCQVVYNNCNDEQQHPTQGRGIVEEKGSGGNTIRFNIAAAISRSRIDRTVKPLTIEGEGSVVKDNIAE